MMGKIVFKKPAIQKAIVKTLSTFEKKDIDNKAIEPEKKRRRKKDLDA